MSTQPAERQPSTLDWLHGHLTRTAEWRLTTRTRHWRFTWHGGPGVRAEESRIADDGSVEPTGATTYIPLIPSASTDLDAVQHQIVLWLNSLPAATSDV